MYLWETLEVIFAIGKNIKLTLSQTVFQCERLSEVF